MSESFDPMGTPERELDDSSQPLDEMALDPAQQSLADALRITFRFIQVVMVALVVLFVGSGFDTVGEGQQGIKLRFGAIQGAGLTPGRQFHWPYPAGELIKVPVGQRTLRIDESFMPNMTENQKNRSLEQNAGLFKTLQPGQDGSLITGDGNLAHAQWSVVYHVENATTYAETMHPQNSERIVRFIVERAAVLSLSQLSIDGFLGQTSSVTSNERIENLVRSSSQGSLDSMHSGIRIDRVTLDQRIPPLAIYDEYQSVSTSEAEAIQAREQSSQLAREALTNIAGLAHEEILSLIDAYEIALSTQNDADADRILTQIDSIMDPEIADSNHNVSGLVSEIISDARRYRTNVVTEAQANAERFQAKLAQFRTNPDVFIASEWASAYLEFLDFASAEIFPVPVGSDMEMILNSDPDIAATLERERNTSQATETMRTRYDSVMEGYRRDKQERKRQQLRDGSN